MVNQIGHAAGEIWHNLKKEGELSMTNLHKKTGLAMNLFYMGVGWLAREGKLNARIEKRISYISLRDHPGSGLEI